MDQLRYAQFNNMSIYDFERRLDLLKKLDVAYSIPAKLPDTPMTKSKAGYNCLHMAVTALHWKYASELLDRGADSLQQITSNGYTPLIMAMNEVKWNFKRYQELLGKLEENKLIDVLLSAHIKSGNTANPKSEDGLTHLHIASVVDHAEAVEFFLSAKESVNLTTNSDAYWLPGYTPLHYAVRYSSVKVAEILSKQGADINQKDAKGVTPLHLLLKRYLDTWDLSTMGKQGYKLLYESEIENLESIIIVLLKRSSTELANFIDETGLSAFHVACVLKDKTIVEDYLKQNIDVNIQVNNNSKLWPGWTPLHFAACSSIEVTKLLLQSKAEVNIKNAKGQTALDLCLMRFTPDIVNSILSTESDFENILLTDGSTKLLDLLSIMNNENEFDSFLQNLSDVDSKIPLDSPLWPGYTVLHLSVLMNEKIKSPEDFDKTSGKARYPFSSPYNCTQEEEAAYMARINICLDRGCSVTAKNAEGQTPIHLAFNLLKTSTVNQLLKHCNVNAVDINDLSLLHIACTVGASTVVERLAKRNKKDLNLASKMKFEWHGTYLDKPCLIPVRANSTPLHVAVIFEHSEVVSCLLNNGADVYAKDSLGFTPIHLSMASHNGSKRTIALMFMWRTPDLRNCLSKDHLSHLHVAAFANDANAIETLLKKGANINEIFKAQVPDYDIFQPPTGEYSFLGRFAGQTPLHVAAWNCGDAVRALIHGGADIHKENPFKKHETPLQIAIDNFGDDFVEHFMKKLKRQNLGIGPVTDSGITLLHFACGRFDLKWAKSLLENGADPNAQVYEGADYTDVEWQGNTPLNIMVFYACIGRKVRRNFLTLIKLLLKYGADVTILNYEKISPVYSAYYSVFPNKFNRDLFNIGNENHNDTAIDDYDDDDDDDKYEYDTITDQQLLYLLPAADLMLVNQKSYNVNPMCSDGFTHFHYACLRNNVEIVSEFLDNGIDINHATDPLGDRNPGFTPLHFAFAHKCKNVARLLIERGTDVKAEDSRGNTPLHIAVRESFINTQLIEMLLSHGADINAENLNRLTPVDFLLDIKGFTLKQLKFFIKHGGIIDTVECSEAIGFALKNVSPCDREAVFKTLIKSCSLKEAVEEGFNAICNTVSFNETGGITFEFYLNAIEQLIKMGYDIDHRNNQGRSALHKAALMYNPEAVNALLLLGADINVVDNYGESLLSECFILDVSETSCRKTQVVIALASHALKMKFVGLALNEVNSDAILESEELGLLEDLSYLNSVCECELAKMKNTMIDQLVSLKDFLLKLGAKNDYPQISLSQHQAIDSFFKQKDKIRNEFPALEGLLMAQYNKFKKAQIRIELLKSARISIISLCEVELPDLCLESIFKYLENNDLKFLTDAAKSKSRRHK